MTIDRLISILVTIMLVEMMIAVGLATTLNELIGIARNWRLILLAVLANYICFPLAAIVLILFFHPADPTVAAGFLILVVCPGAPFGPPCTRIARGDLPAATGLMAILAGSSAIVAPLLLQLLLPLLSGSDSLKLDASRIVGILLATQLLPLCLGLWFRYWQPDLAARLQKPANRTSAVLSFLAIALILWTQFNQLTQIRFYAYAGMLSLLASSVAAGWLLGSRDRAIRKAMTLTTSLRNVGVALAIATASFPGTAAVTAILAYGIIEIAGSMALAWTWGRQTVP